MTVLRNCMDLKLVEKRSKENWGDLKMPKNGRVDKYIFKNNVQDLFKLLHFLLTFAQYILVYIIYIIKSSFGS